MGIKSQITAMLFSFIPGAPWIYIDCWSRGLFTFFFILFLLILSLQKKIFSTRLRIWYLCFLLYIWTRDLLPLFDSIRHKNKKTPFSEGSPPYNDPFFVGIFGKTIWAWWSGSGKICNDNIWSEKEIMVTRGFANIFYWLLYIVSSIFAISSFLIFLSPQMFHKKAKPAPKTLSQSDNSPSTRTTTEQNPSSSRGGDE